MLHAGLGIRGRGIGYSQESEGLFPWGSLPSSNKQRAPGQILRRSAVHRDHASHGNSLPPSYPLPGVSDTVTCPPVLPVVLSSHGIHPDMFLRPFCWCTGLDLLFSPAQGHAPPDPPARQHVRATTGKEPGSLSTHTEGVSPARNPAWSTTKMM